MRLVTCLSVMVVLLLGTATPRALAAHPMAHGNVDFTAGDGVTRSIHFKAKLDDEGATDGDMSFSDPSAAPEGDPDDPAGSSGSPGLVLSVLFDCLVVDANRAVMSGPVVQSSAPSTLGRRFLLTVEDNGEGSQAPPDRLAWGVYGDQTPTWVPTDAELETDTGASLTWIATDAEREDDVGIPSRPSQIVSCESFPLDAYTFVDLDHQDGNIQVQH